VVLLFALALVALSPLLPSFDLGLRLPFLKDISISLTSLFGAVLALVLAIGQVNGEVDRRTIYNILSKPVSRLQFILGKYLGVLATLFMILLVMALEIIVLIYIRVKVFAPSIFLGVFAVFLEAAVIAAFCILFSSFTTVPLGVFATIFFYLLCHVKTGYLHQKMVTGAHGAWRVLAWPVYYLIPNLEDFNVSLQLGYGGGVSTAFILKLVGYSVLWSAILVGIAVLVFSRRDL